MGLFKGRRTSSSMEIDELLSMKDKEIEKVLREKKAPVRSAKELRQMAKDDRRRLEGESGFAAVRGVMKAREQQRQQRFDRRRDDLMSGRDPHALARMKAEDPKRYQALVAQEYERLKSQGKL